MWTAFSSFSSLLDRKVPDGWRSLVGSDFPRVLGVLGLSTLALLALLASSVALGVLGRRVPIPAHYLYQPDTRQADRIPLLVSPSMATGKIERWSLSAAREVVSFNFLNADEHFALQREKFTPSGWAAFQAAVSRSSLATSVKERHLVVTGIPTKRARITEGVMTPEGMMWYIEIPMLLSFTGDNKPVNQSVLCTLIIRQVPSSDSPHGVAIAKISFRSYI